MQHYLITDPKYYTSVGVDFAEKLEQVLRSKRVDFACFRDKTSQNFEELATIFIKIAKEFNIKNIALNANYKLAKKLGANTVHLNSKQFDKIKEAKKLGLYVIISCHNELEIKEAIKKGANAITYSPIFKAINKGKPKGIEELNKITKLYKNLNIFALGGIVSTKEVEKIAKTKAFGFASIRYFII